MTGAESGRRSARIDGGKQMRKISKCLILLLAIIAAVVAVGLIAGLSMWPFIVAYWCTLTAKNLVDYIGG